MPKPPKTPPASDLEGVDRDQVRNTDAALAASQDARHLDRARKESVGRPESSEEEGKENRDDRSR